MTPKEKAEELVSKFRGTFFRSMSDVDAKRCALIAVDEILDVITGIYDYDFEVLNPYWKEVKKEIEKL
jgi:hypothetical protein